MTNKPTVKHREGSRRQKVHALFDKDEAAAFTLGAKLKLKPSTLHTWASKWRAEGGQGQPREGEGEGQTQGRKSRLTKSS